jgi:cation transporter-like permease
VTQPTDPTPTQPQPSEQPSAGPVRRLRVRRSPKYAAFIVTGALIGLLVAIVAGGTGAVDPQFSRAKLIGYLAMALVLVGGLLGAGVAVALERFSTRSRLDARGR